MFWVITEIVSEPNRSNRAKMIKEFIKVNLKMHLYDWRYDENQLPFYFSCLYYHFFNNFQIAQHCYKQTQNFLSMFAIISGLQNRAVTRLKETWKAVPQRYIKIKDDISMIMDPSMNFRKYRNLINNTKVEMRFDLFQYLPYNKIN